MANGSCFLKQLLCSGGFVAAYLVRRLCPAECYLPPFDLRQLQRAVRHETSEVESVEPQAVGLQQLQLLLVEVVSWLSVRDAFLALPSTSRQLQQAYQDVKMHIRSSDEALGGVTYSL